MPIMFAFRAVQMQIAKSKSTKPSKKLQHWAFGTPIEKLNIPFTTLKHPPSFIVSRGQDLREGVGLGVGFGFGGVGQLTFVWVEHGFGFGGVGFGFAGVGHLSFGGFGKLPFADTMTKNRMLRARKITEKPFFGAMI